jgi:hypothetical protein
MVLGETAEQETQKMNQHQTNVTDRKRQGADLSLSSAFPMWVVASMAGWAVIAILLLTGTDVADSTGVIANTDIGDLINFETAAGSAKANP